MKVSRKSTVIIQMPMPRWWLALFYAGLVAAVIGFPGSAVAQQSSDQSRMMEYSERLGEYEQLLRDLTGRVERLEHQLRQANRRIEQLESEQTQARDGATAQGGAGTGLEDEEALEDFDQTAGNGTDSNDQSEPRNLGTLPADEGEDTQDQTGTADAAESADGNLPGGSTTEQYNYAFGLLQEAKWEQAEAALAAFIQEHPDDSLAGNAKYWLGETYYVRQNYVEAAQTFAEGYKDYPDSNKAADNLLKLGMSLANLEQTEDACGTFEELEARYSDASSRILERSGSEREKLGC